MIREGLVSGAAARGKYAPLYHHLSARSEAEWRTSFGEIEAILGFRLPDSARRYRGWWSNRRKDGGPRHALVWQAAGWRTGSIRRLLTFDARGFQRYEGRIGLV